MRSTAEPTCSSRTTPQRSTTRGARPGTSTCLWNGVGRTCCSPRGGRSRSSATSAWRASARRCMVRSEEHTSELQSRLHLVCRLLLEKKKYIEQRDPETRGFLWSLWRQEV